jgi:hypothetical protein
MRTFRTIALSCLVLVLANCLDLFAQAPETAGLDRVKPNSIAAAGLASESEPVVESGDLTVWMNFSRERVVGTKFVDPFASTHLEHAPITSVSPAVLTDEHGELALTYSQVEAVEGLQVISLYGLDVVGDVPQVVAPTELRSVAMPPDSSPLRR